MEQRKHYTSPSRHSASYGRYYTEGSTARKVVEMPERSYRSSSVRRRYDHDLPGRPKTSPDIYSPKRNRQAQLERQRLAQKEKQRRVNQTIAMRNREKALKIDWKYTLFLCGAVLIVLLSCVNYLSIQTQITQKSTQLSSLKSELSTLTDLNSSTQERINDAIDLEYVKTYATEKLGMDYPTESQIVKYKSSADDYVKQYQDIPQSND